MPSVSIVTVHAVRSVLGGLKGGVKPPMASPAELATGSMSGSGRTPPETAEWLGKSIYIAALGAAAEGHHFFRVLSGLVAA